MPGKAKRHSFDYIDWLSEEAEYLNTKPKNDCGGVWGWNPPCGGCSSCIIAQATYYNTWQENKAIWQEVRRRSLSDNTWENEGGSYI